MTRRPTHLLYLSLFLVLVFTFSSYLLADSSESAESGSVFIKSQTTTAIQGSLIANRRSLVSFSSQIESPTRVVVQVKIKGKTLDASADLLNDVKYVDGHNRSLSFKDRLALLRLAKDLERRFQPYKQELPPHLDLLYRAVLLWTEAPTGWPLKSHRIEKPAKIATIPNAMSLATTCPPTDSEVLTCETGPRDDDDGVLELAGGCTVQPYVLGHDTLATDLTNPHVAFCEETQCAGASIPDNCKGRCGPGCGIVIKDGAGFYSYDCAEHDRCCSIHDLEERQNSILGCKKPTPSCGDEYDDAVDDFAWGRPGLRHDNCAAVEFKEIKLKNVSIKGHKYYVSTEKKKWDEAKGICEINGWHLATITIQAEEDIVTEGAQPAYGNDGNGVWIGLTDEASETTFQWITQEPLIFQNWCPGEPNNAGGDEDHVRLIPNPTVNNQRCWNDDRGAAFDYPFVCEKE